MERFPYTCPVCSAIGTLYPDGTLPQIYMRGHFNCGTDCMTQRVGGNKTSRRLWIRGECYRRFLEQWAEYQQGQQERAA